MVVTCENCSARYKLDDNRISGRGAKITCPRCRHVFVVYKERPAVEAQGRVAVGGGVMQPSAPEPEAPSAPSAPFGAAVVAAAASPEPAVGNAEAEVDALDFRKVGIQAWKVKVKIGLVYDFSDYRTLARYIAEGRVTASDKLSYDGSEWTEIAQIPDLAAHFVAVYRQLEAQQAADQDEAEDEDYEDDEPTNIMGMGGGEAFEDKAAKAVSLTSFSSSAAPRIIPSSAGPGGASELQSAMSAALDAEDGGRADAPVGPRFIDPFEKRKSGGRRSKGAAAGSTSGGRPRPRTRTPSAAPKPTTGGGGSRAGLALIGILLLAAAGGGWWFYNQQLAAVSSDTTDTTAPLQPGPGQRDREDIRKDIEADIIGNTEPEVVEDGAEDGSDDDAWGGDEQPELIPVGPRGPSRPKANSPAPSGMSSSGPSARDHAANGDSAMRRGDYSGAATAFRKATGMEPSNSYYNGRLGAALARSGQADAAMGPLMNAASAGYAPAFVDLGDIAASRGDTAGAIGYYQSYLATNPRDAQAVQAKIDRLSGS